MKTEREILIEELAKGDGSVKIGHLKPIEKLIINAMNKWHEQQVKNLNIPDVVQLKCQCKKAQFTRTVDSDFNLLCGRCGKAL